VGAIITEIAESKKVNKEDDLAPGHADVVKAIAVLDRPCQELNTLCREGIDHVLCTLQLGKYTKPSPLARVFSKKPNTIVDDESAKDIGTDAFLTRFDAGLEQFRAGRTNNLDQFYDKKGVLPSQGLFLVLFVEFLLFAVAEEIRVLVIFVDRLRVEGSITRKHFIFPKMRVLRKAIRKIFQSRGAEDVASNPYGAEEGDVFTSHFTGRTKRTPP
jgi:hypothetical protein